MAERKVTVEEIDKARLVDMFAQRAAAEKQLDGAMKPVREARALVSVANGHINLLVAHYRQEGEEKINPLFTPDTGELTFEIPDKEEEKTDVGDGKD